jgi:hypothetical protein
VLFSALLSALLDRLGLGAAFEESRQGGLPDRGGNGLAVVGVGGAVGAHQRDEPVDLAGGDPFFARFNFPAIGHCLQPADDPAVAPPLFFFEVENPLDSVQHCCIRRCAHVQYTPS